MAVPALAGDDDYVQGSAMGPEGQISDLGMEYGVELYDFDKADACVADALQIRANITNVSRVGLVKIELFGERNFMKKSGKLRRIRVPADSLAKRRKLRGGFVPSTSLNIVPVKGQAMVRRFLAVPDFVYAGDENWRPQLAFERAAHLNPEKNPGAAKIENGQLFLALKDDRDVGRIAAFINPAHNAHSNANDGFFGFFDCIDDAAWTACLSSDDRGSRLCESHGYVRVPSRACRRLPAP